MAFRYFQHGAWPVAFIFMILSTAMVSTPLSAQAAGSKIGVIDTQRILLESKAVQKTRAAFFKEVEEQKKVLRAKEAQIRTMALRLERRSSQLSDEALREIRKNHTRQIKEFERAASDIDDELKKKELALTREFKIEIKKIVAAILRERQYAAVFEKKTAIAVAASIEITDDVIKKYDAVHAGE